MTDEDKNSILAKVESGAEPWKAHYDDVLKRAKSALKREANPFWMEDVREIRFGRCGTNRGLNDTVSELCDQLDKQSGTVRDLALAYSLSGNEQFAGQAESWILAWVDGGTLLNFYDFNIDFSKSRFDGMTDSGFCGDRPWNMALDGMWQTYGLINVCDAFVMMKAGGYEFGEGNEERVEIWIRSLAEAVNSSFHAWTRWADAHRGSRAYTRYRSDNHLSWCLAGLMAAAVALDDDDLAAYVLSGGSWKDSKAGVYANPSSIREVIDLAVEADEGGRNHGRIYEEKIRRDPPVGYSFFHLWPMSLVATMAEKRYGENLWSYQGSDGVGLEDAYRRYAGYVLGEMESPRPEQEGSRTGYAWLFEIAASVWPDEDVFQQARDKGNRMKYMRQSIGPVSLIYRR
ncbi:hypothetical protein VDG1235_2082 [Verrucomicrobiia bacterium DG1235]|nr:hypothetical protein VDG1235_2082 [Verrucomicrobiae bacterium DG1235]